MTPRLTDLLSARTVKHFDKPILPARQEQPSAGAKGRPVDIPGQACGQLHPDRLLVPELQRVIRQDDETVAAGPIKVGAVDGRLRHHAQLGSQPPEVPNPNQPIMAHRDHRAVVRRKLTQERPAPVRQPR